MEDHHEPHQYGISELRQIMSGGERLMPAFHFPATTIPSELFGFNLAPAQPQNDHRHHQYQEMNFVPRGLLGLCADPSAPNNNAIAISSGNTGAVSGGGATFSGLLDRGDGGGFGRGDGGGTGRWPRQESLTLLEIRSRLNHKFKEANQKGPLWDEVSRIMSEEHGYQRSGKKCREKFENLYKYYKKTKEGKAGRQDGKNYRFFRQLEALYGDSSNSVSWPETQFISNSLHLHAPTNKTNTSINFTNNQEPLNSPHHHKLSTNDSLSLSNYNSSDLDTSSSDDNDSTRRKRRSWKAKVKMFIDAQMKKLAERQEAWLEKLKTTIEEKEQERILREEEWRKQQAARIAKEHEFWTKERGWMEARDASLMEALQNLTGRKLVKAASSPHEEMIGKEVQNHSDNLNENGSDQTTTNNVSVNGDTNWTESEITRIVELRTDMEARFQEMISGCSDEFLWEEIAAKLACLGYDQRSALMCKEKWECINSYMRRKNKEINKKRKENSSRSCGGYFPRIDYNSVYNQGSGFKCDQINEQGHVDTTRLLHPNNDDGSPLNSNVGNAVSSSCFPFSMGDSDQNLWESYGLRLSKGENQ